MKRPVIFLGLVCLMLVVSCSVPPVTAPTQSPTGSVETTSPPDTTELPWKGIPTVLPWKGRVTVGFRTDNVEGEILTQIMFQRLRRKSVESVDVGISGGTAELREALLAGEIDMYVEYTGNGATFFPDVDPAVWTDDDTAFDEVKRLDFEENKVVWFNCAPANRGLALAVSKELAQRERLLTLEDFASYVNRGGSVILAGLEESLTGPEALAAFENNYGFKLKPEQLVTVPAGDAPLVEKLEQMGTDAFDAVIAPGTDGAIASLLLIVLEDTKGTQVVYQPSAIFRAEVVDKYPFLEDFLFQASERLTTETVQNLNRRVAEGKTPEEVANAYIQGS